MLLGKNRVIHLMNDNWTQILGAMNDGFPILSIVVCGMYIINIKMHTSLLFT